MPRSPFNTSSELPVKPISHYCHHLDAAWVPLPDELNFAAPGNEDYTAAYLNQTEGLQMIASVKDLGAYRVIHVSIGQINFCRPDLNEQELYEHSLSEAAVILELFFPGRGFARAPDDPRKPTLHHYFSIIEEGDE